MGALGKVGDENKREQRMGCKNRLGGWRVNKWIVSLANELDVIRNELKMYELVRGLLKKHLGESALFERSLELEANCFIAEAIKF